MKTKLPVVLALLALAPSPFAWGQQESASSSLPPDVEALLRDMPPLTEPAVRIPLEPTIPLEPVTKVSTQDVQAAQLILDELSEQVRVATTKLNRQTLDRKRTMGKLRSLTSVTDREIAKLTARVQRLEERRRRLIQDLSGSTAEPLDLEDLSAENRALIAQSEKPITKAREELTVLTRRRAKMEETHSQLRREHLNCLLTAAVTPGDDGFDPLDLQGIVDSELAEIADSLGFADGATADGATRNGATAAGATEE